MNELRPKKLNVLGLTLGFHVCEALAGGKGKLVANRIIDIVLIVIQHAFNLVV